MHIVEKDGNVYSFDVYVKKHSWTSLELAFCFQEEDDMFHNVCNGTLTFDKVLKQITEYTVKDKYGDGFEPSISTIMHDMFG